MDLRTSQSINRRLFETSLDLILVTDRRGQFIAVSPSSRPILGYAPDEMIGRVGKEFVFPPDLDSVRSEMRAARRRSLTRHFDCRYVHKAGYPVSISWMGVWVEEEKHHFFIGRDMTEKLEQEARLRHVQRLEALGQMSGGIAHDFNNVLAVIMMRMEAVAEDPAVSAQNRELLNEALTASERGAELISRLMAFAKPRPLNPQDTSIAVAIGDISSLVRTAISARIELKVDVQPDLPPCRIDRSGLDGAILNLAVNARDAMPDGGQLSIMARKRHIEPEQTRVQPRLRPGDWVDIAVRDTGVGIPEPMQDKVFEPFFTTKGEGKGTGLGLPMVNGFAEQSGGFLTLESAPGRGTAFHLFLPPSPAAALPHL